MSTAELKEQKLVEFLTQINWSEEIEDNIDWSNLDLADIEDYDQLYEYLNDNGYLDVEIIYYSTAIKYLSENDPSLHESLEIAEEYGFQINKLSSEVLASLLASQNCKENFSEHQKEINEFFDNIDDEIAGLEEL